MNQAQAIFILKHFLFKARSETGDNQHTRIEKGNNNSYVKFFIYLALSSWQSQFLKRIFNVKLLFSPITEFDDTFRMLFIEKFLTIDIENLTIKINGTND